MKYRQQTIHLSPKRRGFHLITDEIICAIEYGDISVGMMNIFLQHTSASLSINENYEREVRDDLENLLNEMCDDKPYYTHTYEGADDMPSHAKSAMLGVSLNVPITEGRLNLGTWQGIYLNEHRNKASSRTLIVTIHGV